jgi:hypothetical protein
VREREYCTRKQRRLNVVDNGGNDNFFFHQSYVFRLRVVIKYTHLSYVNVYHKLAHGKITRTTGGGGGGDSEYLSFSNGLLHRIVLVKVMRRRRRRVYLMV